jgi:hypothetical protein
VIKLLVYLLDLLSSLYDKTDGLLLYTPKVITALNNFDENYSIFNSDYLEDITNFIPIFSSFIKVF